MSETISAALVAAGVGLPPMWMDVTACVWEFDPEYPVAALDDIDLNDEQTAYGVACRLDRWERAGDFGYPREPHSLTWPERVAHAGVDHVAEALASRLTHIGMDAAVRRALGHEPKLGTLAVVEFHKGCWTMHVDGRVIAQAPALKEGLPTGDALAAIYAEVCS